MKLTKINRSKSFEMVNGYGLKSWQKYGIEGDLSENEDPIQAYKELDSIIDQAHKENNQEVSFVANSAPVPVVEVDKKKDPKQDMIDAIKGCTDVVVLKTFEKLVKNSPAFQPVYDETMELLTNKKD